MKFLEFLPFAIFPPRIPDAQHFFQGMKASIIFAAAASASSTVQVLEGSSGTWSSPGYPNGYSKGVTKSYAKSVGPREILVLDFVDFDIEMDADVSQAFQAEIQSILVRF